MHGIRVLKAFGRGKHALQKFTSQAETLRETELRKAGAVGWIWFWLVLLPDIAFALCLGAGIYLVQVGQLQTSELIAFFAMATVLRWPMESIGFLFSFMLDARTATDRIFEVFDEENTIVDPDSPETIVTPRGELAFEGVHFRYQDAANREQDLLDGIDLVLRPGETMALVGLTGSGKTTLTTLPARLYDVTEGRVTVDGVDVRDLELTELRTHVGMAFEDATLFSQSVRDNVLLGREELEPGSPEAEAVLREALDVAQAGLRRRPARRRRHGHRRRGPDPLGRPASAPRARARRRGPAGGARARRPAVGARRRHRGARRGRAARGAPRDDGARRRAPPVDRHARRPRRAARGRPHHRRRPSLRPAPRERPLPTRDLESRGRGSPPAGEGGEPVSTTTVTGTSGEDRSDYTRDESRAIRRRSLRLLGSLVTPVRWQLVLAGIVLVVSTALRVAGPALIAYGINTALPAVIDDMNWMPTIMVVAVYLITGIGGAALIGWYVVVAARLTQAIMLDLRKRIFLHTQRLSLEFHESYTSGRIISRQTSDLDSIRELLDGGLNELVSGVLYGGVHPHRAAPDRLAVGRDPAGHGHAAGAADAVVLHALAARLPRVAGHQREGHRQVRRDDDRHPRRQGVPQGGRATTTSSATSRATTATSTCARSASSARSSRGSWRSPR